MLNIDNLEEKFQMCEVVEVPQEDLYWSDDEKAIRIRVDSKKTGAYIPFDQITMKCDSTEKIEKEVRNILKNSIKAIVIGKDAHGEYVLSRKDLLIKASLELRTNEIINGTIRFIKEKVLYLELENGANALMYMQDACIRKCDDLRNYFNIGEIIKVRIIEIEDAPTYKVIVSRKNVEPMPNMKLGTIYRSVRIIQVQRKDKYVVEIIPEKTGITYSKHILRQGQLCDAYLYEIKGRTPILRII